MFSDEISSHIFKIIMTNLFECLMLYHVNIIISISCYKNLPKFKIKHETLVIVKQQNFSKTIKVYYFRYNINRNKNRNILKQNHNLWSTKDNWKK